ncbi:MAG: DNA-3-methyladenine glycosylase [Bdellovibrionaceae bacterium]|nr:DNA-3-methyladenine glycosylase [Pseudobdellovibrionaceae bacterium]
MSRKLPRDFYERGDVVAVARDLLGKLLCTRRRGVLTAGRIVEVEAYAGKDDRACHAHGGRRTMRNQVMYGPGGHAYVYLCYGLHVMFNVVTNREGRADAVLVRALEPVAGGEVMRRRRKLGKDRGNLTSGPGVLTQAMGLTLRDNRADLLGDTVWIEDCGLRVEEIACGTRIGVDYAGVDAIRPWRFWIKGCPMVSRGPNVKVAGHHP